MAKKIAHHIAASLCALGVILSAFIPVFAAWKVNPEGNRDYYQRTSGGADGNFENITVTKKSIFGSNTSENVTVTILNNLAFDYVFSRNNTNSTEEAKSSGGTAFIPFNSTQDLFLGKNSTFSSIYHYASANATNCTLFLKYWNGTGWNDTSFIDFTSNYSQSGGIYFTPPSDWKNDVTVENISGVYWVKIGTTSLMNTTAFDYVLTPSPASPLMIYSQPGDTNPVIYISQNGNVTFGSTAQTNARFYFSGTTKFASTASITDAAFNYERGLNNNTRGISINLYSYSMASSTSTIRYSPEIQLTGYSWNTNGAGNNARSDWTILNVPTPGNYSAGASASYLGIYNFMNASGSGVGTTTPRIKIFDNGVMDFTIAGTSGPSTVAAGSVTNRYGGATNFLGNPSAWLSVSINGTTYKVPAY